MAEKAPQSPPPQTQPMQPGHEHEMEPLPKSKAREYLPAGKLKGKVAIITGGDSGIGRSVAVMFAKEGANVTVAYLNEHEDARETERLIGQADGKCLLFAGDIGDSKVCQAMVDQTVQRFGRLDILVNNAAEQHPVESLEEISDEQLLRTFQTNIFAMFYTCRAALKHLKEGASIINTTSVTAYKGQPQLLDYSSTKGAIVGFTRALSLSLSSKGIRVNAVAPGPIWTPLIPASFPEEKVGRFGADTPMGRPGEPDEVATCFVFLASDDASYISGQCLHPNGGFVING